MENLPGTTATDSPRFEDLSEEVAFLRRWQASLAAGRLGRSGVARRLRGRGAGPDEHSSCKRTGTGTGPEEMVGRIGLDLAAPTLLAHGTTSRRTRWLSRIRTADDLWWQLFSEPGAGSDLAGVPPGRPGGGRLAGQRPEGVDLLCPIRRFGRLPGPH